MAKKKMQDPIPAWIQARMSSADEALGEIVWRGAPRQYRADGASGQFYRGTQEIGGILNLKIFDYRWVREERWDFPAQVWLDLAAIDSDGQPAICSLKKDGASNTFDRLIEAGQIPLFARTLTLALEEQVKDGDRYWIVAARYGAWLDQTEAERIERFAASGQFEYILLGEVGDE